MTNDVELLFMLLYAMCKVFKSFTHFKIGFFSYYYLYDFFNRYLFPFFFVSLWLCLFIFFTVTFEEKKVLCVLCHCLNHLCLNSGSQGFPPVSLQKFYSLFCTLSLWSISLDFCRKCERNVSFFAYRYLIFLAPFVEKNILPSLNYFDTFVSNKLTISKWIYFWILHSVQ